MFYEIDVVDLNLDTNNRGYSTHRACSINSPLFT